MAIGNYKQATVALDDEGFTVQADDDGCVDWTAPKLTRAEAAEHPERLGKLVLEAMTKLGLWGDG